MLSRLPWWCDHNRRAMVFFFSFQFVPIETRYPPEWIHDPSAASPKMELDNVPYRDTWEAMEVRLHALFKSLQETNGTRFLF